MKKKQTENLAIKGTLVIHPVRGVIYFYAEKGDCLLRLEGVKAVRPDGSAIEQIDVHLKPWGASQQRDSEGRLMVAEVIGLDKPVER
jgi:hypothetical protein